MTTRELEEEARRILLRALGFHSGVLLRATFKNGKRLRTLFYFNPKDIPLKIMDLYMPLYLWSVQTSHQIVDAENMVNEVKGATKSRNIPYILSAFFCVILLLFLVTVFLRFTMIIIASVFSLFSLFSPFSSL